VKLRRFTKLTRKQALCKALEYIADEDTRQKIQEIMGDMPFTGWSERTIFDTIDQFILDNGRPPTTTDFKKKGLPPHTVITLRFGINLKEFLDKFYPAQEFWKTDFIEQYHFIKPSSAEQYNKQRRGGTPSWPTVAGLFGITKWLEWLKFCEIAPKISVTSVITIVSGDSKHKVSLDKDVGDVLY
jgi:hypothetical protein